VFPEKSEERGTEVKRERLDKVQKELINCLLGKGPTTKGT
jgi:hypothetical protein